jgi:hypothetical protein
MYRSKSATEEAWPLQLVYNNTHFCTVKHVDCNNTGNVRITQHCDAVEQPLLQWWKSNNYYILRVWFSSLRYPACNARAPYCHLWPAPLYNIFPHYLINGTIFGVGVGGKVSEPKLQVLLPLQILSETFLVLKSTERDMIKNVNRSSCKVPVILVRF